MPRVFSERIHQRLISGGPDPLVNKKGGPAGGELQMPGSPIKGVKMWSEIAWGK